MEPAHENLVHASSEDSGKIAQIRSLIRDYSYTQSKHEGSDQKLGL